jgi:hypothetical protein
MCTVTVLSAATTGVRGQAYGFVGESEDALDFVRVRG